MSIIFYYIISTRSVVSKACNRKPKTVKMGKENKDVTRKTRANSTSRKQKEEGVQYEQEKDSSSRRLEEVIHRRNR